MDYSIPGWATFGRLSLLFRTLTGGHHQSSPARIWTRVWHPMAGCGRLPAPQQNFILTDRCYGSALFMEIIGR